MPNRGQSIKQSVARYIVCGILPIAVVFGFWLVGFLNQWVRNSESDFFSFLFILSLTDK